MAYAVDTDVIMLFADPTEKSIPQQHRSFGYARIFRDDDKKLSIAFGQSLAEHIFTQLAPGGGPLMVMPSLEAENAARDEVVKRRAAIEELKPFADRPDELAEQLKTRAPELAEILRSARSPHAVLHRFGRLFSDERISRAGFPGRTQQMVRC